MSPYKQARAIYRAIEGDAQAIQSKRAEFNAAATAITSPTGGMQLTGGTENGNTFTSNHSSTSSDRLQVLSILMGMIDRGSAGKPYTIPRFY